MCNIGDRGPEFMYPEQKAEKKCIKMLISLVIIEFLFFIMVLYMI